MGEKNACKSSLSRMNYATNIREEREKKCIMGWLLECSMKNDPSLIVSFQTSDILISKQ